MSRRRSRTQETSSPADPHAADSPVAPAKSTPLASHDPASHHLAASRPAASRASVSRSRWLLWWTLGFLLILGTNSRWLVENELVLPPPTDAVLAPDGTWSPLLSRWEVIQGFAEWPVWLYAMAAAVVIATAGHFVERVHSAWLAVLLTIGLSLGMRGDHLLPAILLLAGFRLLAGIRLTDGTATSGMTGRRAALGIVWLTVVLLTTLEFGFLILVVGAWGTVCGWKSGTRRQRVIGGLMGGAICGGFAIAAANGVGWGVTFWRPISIWWLHPERWLPSTGFALSYQPAWPWSLLLGVCVIEVGRQLLNSPGDRKVHWVPWLMLAFIGFSSSRYLWLSALAAVWMLPVRPLEVSPVSSLAVLSARIGRVSLLAGFLLATVRLAGMSPQFSEYFVTGQIPPRQIDVTQWGLRGPVMLMNLEHAPDWRSKAIRSRFHLLMDDRWDVFGEDYPAYAAVCRDLAEIRNESYWRTDGQWGGYLRWTKAWQPALLVVDTGDLDAIRRVSLNPHWQFLGIDSRRTIFGNSDDPRSAAPSRHALRELFRLEWPRGNPGGADPRVLLAGTDDERRQAAAALIAFRLPYAALRILPDDDSWDTEQWRIWCDVELAHRVHRYTGTHSLTGQLRAIVRLQQAREARRWSPAELLRIAHSLEVLGENQVAGTFARDLLDDAAPSSVDEIQRQLAQQILDRYQEQLTAPSAAPADLSAEQRIRQAMLRGDLSAATSELDALSHKKREYYALLLSVVEQPARVVVEQLLPLLADPEFPEELRGEAYFVLGELALEHGDGDSALAALTESARVQPTSPIHPLRLFYRQMLSNR